MPKLTRIYTRTGDDGTTGLVGGSRVKKSAPRIETYGTLDELSAVIGIARSSMQSMLSTNARAQRLDGWLAWTQDVLFNLGSELATPQSGRREGTPLVTAADAVALERAIDAAQADLPPLDNFIHPGGNAAGATLHLARTVCRRAERLLVALRAAEDDISPQTQQYLNRLSDALFVWARWINAETNTPEHLWNPKSKPPE
jgi:cob(I)alamin adenosyltransferase